MSPNGRRAWRAAARKLRRLMGRRWRSPEAKWSGKRWSELVPDIAAHRAHVTGAWFRRHGCTDQGLRTLDAPNMVRVYVGLWGTVDGDGVEYAVKHKPFTARSLVGMTMGARKRAVLKEMKRKDHPDNGQRLDYWKVRSTYRIGERLRPCPGCCACWGHRISSAYGEIAECCGPQTSGKRKSQIKAMRKWQETLADNCDGAGAFLCLRTEKRWLRVAT